MRNFSLGILLAIAVSATANAQETNDPAAQPFRDFEAGRYSDAEVGAEAALAQDPDNSVWWALLAEARAKNGNTNRQQAPSPVPPRKSPKRHDAATFAAPRH